MRPRRRRHTLPRDLQRHPQLAVVTALRAVAGATVPALLRAHPQVAADRLSTTTEIAADNVIRLAQRLRCALDDYRETLLDDDLSF